MIRSIPAITAIAVAATLMVAAGLAAADEKKVPEYDPSAAFAEADTNGDGFVDRREFHVRIVEVFFFADGDRDGYMTWAELRGAVALTDDYAGADTDGDDRISLHEFIEVGFDNFPIADSDQDGRLSEEEVVKVFERGGVR
ncbi:MAG: EF-hand domain-containing protein [Myxococcota bacterium]